MSISYNGVIGHKAKVTMPSVSSWGTNMNILRDPPKSIMTRRKDKALETSGITELIDRSGNRSCEYITQYARGVNPFVGVSYQNYGTNGGQRVNGFSNGTRQNRQAYLPYTIGKGGAIRLPARDQRSLLPLSRQPRVWTSSFTQPGFPDFSKKAMCPQNDCKGVKTSEQTLKTCIRPTATYKIETPIVEPFEVKYVIQNPIQVSGNSGVRTLDLTTQEVKRPTKIIDNPLHAHVNANIGSSDTIRGVDVNVDTDPYIQNSLHSAVESKKSQNIQITSIEDIFNTDIRTKEQFNIPYTAPSKGHEKQDYIHDNPELRRPIPVYNARTNIAQNIYKKPVEGYQRTQKLNRPVTSGTTNRYTNRQNQVDRISNRNYRLHPTINPGGFEGKGTLPVQGRNQNHNGFVSHRAEMSKKVIDMQLGRR